MLRQDIRHAMRALGRQPGFSAAIIVTLALGIGGSAAIFGAVDAAFLRPLPYAHVDRLYELWAKLPGEIQVPLVSREVYERWREQSDLFERVEAQETGSVVAAGMGEPRTLVATYLTPGALDMLGIVPLRGRAFEQDEAVPGGPGVVLLTESFWRESLGADPDVIGRTIELDDEAHEILGVMPREFRYPLGTSEIILPLIAAEMSSLVPVAKLRNGITEEQASERIEAVAESLQEDQPRQSGWAVALHSLDEKGLPGNTRSALFFLGAAVLGVLMIGCVNAANLFLVHGTSRSHELAVRSALGATRTRIVRSLLIESLLLAGAAAVCGLLIAQVGIALLDAFAPASFVSYSRGNIRIDARVAGFASCLALVTAALFGLIPSWLAARRRSPLAGSERGSTGDSGVRRARTALVVGELALSMTLLVAAGLLARSVSSLLERDIGFDADGLISLDVSLPMHRYQDQAAHYAFYAALLDRLRAVPGVSAATLADGAPPSAAIGFGLQLEAEGRAAPEEGQPTLLSMVRTDDAYFDVLGIPLLDGRSFNSADRDGAVPVAIIDENFARFLWPNGRAVGQRFRLSDDGDWLTVVGVARDIALFGYAETRASACIGGGCEFDLYRPIAQAGRLGQHTVTLRTARPPALLVPAIREAVWSLDATIPLPSVSTVRQRFSDSLDNQRFVSWLTSIFTAFALLLTAIGVYGVLAYAVGRRTREFGIRIALGARSGDVFKAVIGTTTVFVGAGVILGVAGALYASRLMRSLVFDVAPTDPLALGSAAFVLCLVAIAASLGPARRAVRVSPLEALRID